MIELVSIAFNEYRNSSILLSELNDSISDIKGRSEHFASAEEWKRSKLHLLGGGFRKPAESLLLIVRATDKEINGWSE